MTTSVTDILGPKGRIAARLKQYECRSEQFAMAEAVAAAIAEKRHLLVEAGTGVGKSFAYLVPAILAATQDQQTPKQENDGGEEESGPSRRVIVSTHTISLQEQLMSKDLPLLKSVLPWEFTSVLVKGRSNYISLRRLRSAVERATSMFASEGEFADLRRVNAWSRETTDGSLSDIDRRPLPSVWDEARSDHGNCMGRKCPTYNQCFYYRARRRVQNAQILVVNHALYFSDLALRREGASILPNHDVVIFDEAHTLEAVAGDHLGMSVASSQVEYALNKLYNERTQRGLLVHHDLNDEVESVDRCRHLTRDFFDDLRAWQQLSGRSNGR
ncbi:MAG: helicase, partial [Planctomycetia bacterium 21-64-5]